MRFLQKLGLQHLVLNKKDKRLASTIKMMVGSKPFNIVLYRLAITPSGLQESTSNGFQISYERLEFLGDAVLGAVVADYLYLKYPYRNEGFLTETRSKLVNREVLHTVGMKIGLKRLFSQELDGRSFTQSKSLYGDMLEALVGAIYLDKGYTFTRKFILKRLLIHFDIQEAVNTTINYKSKIIEWGQKESKAVHYKLLGVTGNQRLKEFTVALEIDGEEIAKGTGSNKKKAEQNASENACKVLNIAD